MSSSRLLIEFSGSFYSKHAQPLEIDGHLSFDLSSRASYYPSTLTVLALLLDIPQ